MKLIIYIMKAVAGILGFAGGCFLIGGGIGLFVAIRDGAGAFVIISCCVIIAASLGLGGLVELLTNKADDLERKREEKLAPKSGHRSASYGDIFGSIETPHVELDDDWWDLQDDLDRMDAITAKYGPDWVGYDPEKDYPDCSDYE